MPRRLMRVATEAPVHEGMVVREPNGLVFMLAKHGFSEGVFKNFRMFEADGQHSWKTRSKIADLVTGLPRDNGPVEAGPIWGCYEPTPEVYDRQTYMNFETGRFITTPNILRDDMIDDRRISRVNCRLGLYVAVLG